MRIDRRADTQTVAERAGSVGLTDFPRIRHHPRVVFDREIMAVDDRTRLNLLRRLEAVLGQEEAETLMAHLPPVTWQEVVTKTDLRVELHAMSSTLRLEMAELRTEMAELRTEIAHAVNSQTWRLATFIGTWSVLLVSVTALLR